MSETVVIHHRFCGPPESGNGGYVSGVAASHLDRPAQVTLRRPPPLDRPLAVERTDAGHVRLLDGDELIVEAAPAELDLEIPEPPELDEAGAGVGASPSFDADNPFPTCFVCGPKREPGDGLRIFAGPVPGREMVAATWTPDASLGGEDGLVRPEFLWAALDCPGAFAIYGSRSGTVVLGRMAARIDSRPRPGERCTVVGWPLGREGRKHHAATALFDARRRPCAVARQTWIELRADRAAG